MITTSRYEWPQVSRSSSDVFKGGHWAMPPKIFWRLNVVSKAA